MIEVMVVVLIISVIFSVGTPYLILARENSRAKNCSRNLKNIEGAKEQYALDKRLNPPTIINVSDLWTAGNSTTNYLKTEPKCPANGSYPGNAVGIAPVCSRAVSFPINDKGGRFPHTFNGQ